MGNGRRIKFWEDVWWGEEAFSNKFVDLCRLSLAHNGMIVELCVSQHQSLSYG